MRNALVAAEIALSLVLLLSAGLLMRSFISLLGVDLGFDPRNVLVYQIMFAPGEDATPAAKDAFYQQAIDRITSLPGVEAAAVAAAIPPFGGGFGAAIEIPGVPRADRSFVQFCTDGYFRTAGIRVLRGREWVDASANEAARMAIVNETFATAFFGADAALGKQIAVEVPTGESNRRERRVFEIAGVVQDVRNQGVRQQPAPQVYLHAGTTIGNPGILVRTSSDAHHWMNAIRAEIRRVSPHVAIREPGTLDEMVQRFAHAQPRFSLLVLGVFAAAGTLLVAIGVFGVMAYTVARQTREIAVRIALGAHRGEVMALVLRSGIRLLIVGVGAGLLASFGTSRIIATQLWHTSPHDPSTIAAAVAIIACVALSACYFPARRAMRVDPMQALRAE